MEECVVKKQKRNVWLDLFRYLLAFMVVCIHFDKEIFGFNIKPLCRLAVPMFFMISGFFASAENKENEIEKAKNGIKRTLKYYLIGVVIAILYDVIPNITNGQKLNEIVMEVFNKDMFFNFFVLNKPLSLTGAGVLWFLNALIVVQTFHYIMLKFFNTKIYKYLIPVCVFLFMYPAYCTKLFSTFVIPVVYRRNWMFLGLPCFAIGFLLSKFLKRRRNDNLTYAIISLFAALVFWGLSFLEFYCLVDLSYYISSLFAAVFFLIFFDYLSKRQKISDKETKFSNFFYYWIGAGGAFYIYITHCLVGDLLKVCIKSSFLLNILIFVCCFVIYEIFFLSVKMFKYLKSKKSTGKN